MEENTTNSVQTLDSKVLPTSTPINPVTTSAVSSPLFKRPIFWLGIGAIIIVILGYLYMSVSNTTPANQQVESTENVQIQPTGTIEIQEPTEADAIEVGNIDEDFNEIKEDLNQL